MGTIHEVAANILKLDLRTAIPQIINEDSENLADRQAMQMNLGFKSNDRPITPEYSPFTIEEKRKKGQPADRVTLRDTGAFQAAIRVYADHMAIVFGSDDSKTSKLEEKYTKDIFGLNTNFTEDWVNESFYPKLKKHIEEVAKL